ncbi:hypothetical protein CO669_17190 [Bradyrhizobium sp. Y36]|uniref:hypothetical protein n=1 Tax=Bradyrhizobium sp. Y36 TaxID=2035447 RepID=UPI000BE994EE|nr:hypothetical protein [Bradyrhizobium sp. Y36]PDT88871.1 hypothetical protein CO669_17190 [Bradyrhizobium sp. Y36]
MWNVVTRKANRFFRSVWRFNAIVLAGALVVFIFLAASLAWSLFGETTRTRRVTNVVNVGEQEKVSEEFSLGTPYVLVGTPYVRVALVRGQAYAGSYSLKRSEQNTVNYLFMNASNGEVRWLFDRANQLIIEGQVVFDKAKITDNSRSVVGLLYVIVDRDTNGDNRLTERDAVSVATSDLDGTNYRKLIEGIEQLYSVHQITDDKVLVLYQKDKQSFSQLYSLPSMQPLKQAIIPKVGLN